MGILEGECGDRETIGLVTNGVTKIIRLNWL